MKVTEIILHCSATKENADFSVTDIDKWHKKRGFKKVGYHYVIRLDGTLEKGREETEIGAHCTGHNSKSIGICYIGGLDEDGKPKDTRTHEQKETLYNLISKLLLKYNLSVDSIHCHNEFANKSCPCFNKDDIIKELNNWIGYEMEQGNKG